MKRSYLNSAVVYFNINVDYILEGGYFRVAQLWRHIEK